MLGYLYGCCHQLPEIQFALLDMLLLTVNCYASQLQCIAMHNQRKIV